VTPPVVDRRAEDRRWRESIAAALAGLLTIAWGADARADHVERRGGLPLIQGTIASMDDSGVTIRSDLGASHSIPWDRVRRVVADAETMSRAERRMEAAVALWRARSRVERNDTALAEALFERLFETYRGQTHETALVVAEGLLRCRLARGEHLLAVIPSLETIRLRRAGVTTPSYGSLPAVIDAEFELCTLLPPAWVQSPLLPKTARDLASYDAQGDAVVAALALMYADSVSLAHGDIPAARARGAPDHAGAALLGALVDCLAPEPSARQAARERLASRLGHLPPWAEAWARYQTGVSLLGEPGIVRQQRGMVQLLHLPAEFASSQSYLAGCSLRLVADGLEAHGRREESELLAAELAARFPYHPVRAFPPAAPLVAAALALKEPG
jgi:hypothetical protein